MATTNMPEGITNTSENSTLGSYVAPDPSTCHQFFDDFDKFNAITAATTVDPTGAADWSLARTFTGTPTAVIAADGGILALTNGTANADNSFVRWKGQNATTVVASTFRWQSDKSMWFKARFKISDANLAAMIMGLAITDQSPLDATDGFYFLKASASTTLNFVITKGGTSTTIPVGTMVSDTYVTVGFNYLSETGRLTVTLNGNPVGGATAPTNFPDTQDLTTTFGIQNGEGVAKIMSVDYIMASKKR